MGGETGRQGTRPDRPLRLHMSLPVPEEGGGTWGIGVTVMESRLLSNHPWVHSPTVTGSGTGRVSESVDSLVLPGSAVGVSVYGRGGPLVLVESFPSTPVRFSPPTFLAETQSRVSVSL